MMEFSRKHSTQTCRPRDVFATVSDVVYNTYDKPHTHGTPV